MMLNTNSALKTRRESEVWRSWSPKRGDVVLINFGEGLGSEQKNLRPAVVVSNNINNQHSPVIQVAPLTSKSKANLPVHVRIGIENGLKNESLACIEQIRCVCKSRGLINGKVMRITQLSDKKMYEIDRAIKIQFGLF